MYFITAIILAVSSLLLWRFFRKTLFKVFEEIFVVYHIMGGGEGYYRVADISNLRIYPFITKTRLMDEALLKDVHQFSNKYLTDQAGPQYLQKAILKYSHIMLLRDRISGTLRGTALFTFRKEKNYTLFMMGGLMVDPLYRGETYMYLAPAFYVFKELFWHPRTPIYLCAKLFSYKSYLTAMKLFDSVYPRYNKKTPDHIQEILVKFGNSLVGINETFDPETCVIHRTAVALKEGVAKITEQDRQNPHIKFFEEKNPDWSKGDCLVMIGYLNWPNMFRVVRRALSKANKGRSSTSNEATSSCATNESEIYQGVSFFRQNTVSDVFSNIELNEI